MYQYNTNSSLPTTHITLDVENCIRLRGDIRTAFNRGDFTILPKCGSYYIHFLRRTGDYGNLYHNRKSYDIKVGPEFLFAHFAWTILPMASTFARRAGTHILVRSSSEDTWKETVVSTTHSIKRRRTHDADSFDEPSTPINSQENYSVTGFTEPPTGPSPNFDFFDYPSSPSTTLSAKQFHLKDPTRSRMGNLS